MSETFRFFPQIDRYKTLELLTENWSTWVLKVQNNALERIEILKVLKPRYAQSPAAVDAFFKASKALSLVEHEHVAKAFDVGHTPDGLVYASHEYIEGDSLAELIGSNRRFSITEALKWGVQLARVLEELYSQKLTGFYFDARDVVIDQRGNAVLLEIHFADGVEIELRKEPCICPEASKQSIDIRCGIYYLGRLLFETLTGSIFTAEGLRSYPPSVPRRVQLIVEKSLHPNPGKRYQSGNELIEEIEGRQGTSSRPAGLKKTIPWVVTMLAAAFIGGLIYTNWGNYDDETEKKAPASMAPISEQDSTHSVHESIEPLLALDTFPELIERLKHDRDNGVLVFGRKNEFSRPDLCYIFVFGKTDESLIAVLAPGQSIRTDLSTNRPIQNVNEFLADKAGVWVLPTR